MTLHEWMQEHVVELRAGAKDGFLETLTAPQRTAMVADILHRAGVTPCDAAIVVLAVTSNVLHEVTNQLLLEQP